MNNVIESGEDRGEPAGVSVMDLMMDMPLYIVLNYLEVIIPVLPEKMMNYLLAKINGLRSPGISAVTRIPPEE
jgi:hypothetical protein